MAAIGRDWPRLAAIGRDWTALLLVELSVNVTMADWPVGLTPGPHIHPPTESWMRVSDDYSWRFVHDDGTTTTTLNVPLGAPGEFTTIHRAAARVST